MKKENSLLTEKKLKNKVLVIKDFANINKEEIEKMKIFNKSIMNELLKRKIKHD